MRSAEATMTLSTLSSVYSFLAPTLILIVAYVIVIILAYRFGAPTEYGKAFLKSSTPAAILAAVNAGGVYLIVLAISAQFSGSPQDFSYSVASATFGLALGWVLGIIISPGSKDEASEFSNLTKAISTFLTGYLLGYIKDIKLENVHNFFARPQVPFRLMIGTACCFSTIAVVFISRRAEAVKSNLAREWFISYAPADPKHADTLSADLLARGPFPSREEALAEIASIKGLDQYKGVTLRAVRIDILSQDGTPPTGTAAAIDSNDAAQSETGQKPDAVR